MRYVLPLLLFVASVCAARAEEPARGIPLKPDPPFAIDGNLEDWGAVPGAIPLDRREQVTWGQSAWASKEDLSGTVRLAWRTESLFIAANVVDDQVRQSGRGSSLWKGDHIELYFDVQPDLEPARDALGAGQFQIHVSPGNFLKSGDALADCAPEAYCYRPEGTGVAGIEVAARRTPAGYTLEVAIPWRLLKVDRPERGMPIRYEVGLSDTDSPEAKQESLMTTATAEWGIGRKRMNAAGLAGSDGIAPEVVRRVPIVADLTLKQGEKKAFVFTAPATPKEREGVVALKARLQSPKVAGHNPGMRLLLNGTAVSGDRLLNKPAKVRSRGGAIWSMHAGERLTTWYSPDFQSPDLDAYYGLVDNVKPCEFVLKVTDLLKVGENTLTIEDVGQVQNPLVVGDVRLEFQMPPPPPRKKAGPPTGPLEAYAPGPQRTAFKAKDAGAGRLEVTVGGERFVVESRFSTPKPAWVSGQNEFFDYRREVETRPDALVVRETFTNRTKENLGLMQRHEVSLGEGLKRLWLAGLEQGGTSGAMSQPANPTAFAATAGHGVGLIALSDPFRVHVATYAAGGKIGIADNNFVLRPGASHTAEWAIVPTAAPDYWQFLNAARRVMDANFTTDGGFAFFRAGRLTEPWSDPQTADFIHNKDARYVCASIPYIGGHVSHGTLFQKADFAEFRRAFERRRKLVPGVKNLVYFHCFLDASPDAAQKFADSVQLRPDGKQGDYGDPVYKLFLPLATNSFGPAVAKNVDIILDTIGAEGVYWDEHEYSAYTYHYGEPWDGVTGDIDPQKMTVTQRKSSVTLLTEAWRLAQAKRILARGPLIGNGPPVTRAMAALKFPCFVETGSISHCAQAQLHSPIALGDHLTERTEKDAYGVMLGALDYGCVYHWYDDVHLIPTHYSLTRYMYPFTPVELHNGYVIGKERILTKKSGLFGWGDASQHEVHVFNDEGREVEGFKAPLVRRDGKTYTELRLAEDWSAAIVRK